MCEGLSELREATVSYTASIDVSKMSPAQAARVVEDATVIESSISTLKALAAARVAEGTSWKKEGHRSAAEALAQKTGSSVSSAREFLEVGRRLQSQPEVDSLARRGKLSSAQLSMVTNAAEADPSAAMRLLDEAQRSCLASLKDTCARTKALAHPDLDARRMSIYRARSLRSWTDLEGVWRLSASGNPEDGAQIMAALAPITDRLFREARREGRREPPTAYALDALVQVAREATSSSDRATSNRTKPRGAPVKLLLRVDFDTLLRGAPREGEICELVGYGPISVSAVEDLLECGSPLVAAILTKAKAIVGVAHLGRQPTVHQQSALEFLYPTCAAEGCASRARLERDHRIDWSKTHITMFDLLDLLCSHHHDLKTRENWQLVEGHGKRSFVPPDDSRHPRHKQRRTSNRATGPPN